MSAEDALNPKSAILALSRSELDVDTFRRIATNWLTNKPDQVEKIVTELEFLHDSGEIDEKTNTSVARVIQEITSVPTVQRDSPDTTVPLNPTVKRTVQSPSPTGLEDMDSDLLSRESLLQSRSNKTTAAMGAVLAGNYQLDQIVGEGGMGVVWRAIDLLQVEGEGRDPYVAVKFLSKDFRNHPDALKALLREFARYKTLSHPNIVSAYMTERIGSSVYMIMEYLRGSPLDEYIHANPAGLSLEQAKSVIRDVGAALSHAHSKGIVHLDMKPSNIFYDPEAQTAKVIDFGISRLATSEDREQTNFDPGDLHALTMAYASLEMLTGEAEKNPDPRDDIYGFACVAYQVLAGHHPFQGKSASTVAIEKLTPEPLKQLSKSQNQALAKGLASKRKQRTSSVSEFVDGVLGVQKKTVRPGFVIASVLAVVLTIAGVWFFNERQKENQRAFISGIQDSILANDANAAASLMKLSEAQQRDVLSNSSVSEALVSTYLRDTQTDPIDQIQQFEPPGIKNLLLQNRVNTQQLIDHYIAVADNAIESREYANAISVINKIGNIYQDSKALADMRRDIAKARVSDLENLQIKFNACKLLSNSINSLNCANRQMVEYSKVAPANVLVDDPWLVKTYNSVGLELLAAGRNEELDKLLTNWSRWIPGGSDNEEQLDTANDVMQRLKAGNLDIAQLPDILLTPETRGLLNLPEFQQVLVSFFDKDIVQRINRQDYFGAEEMVTQAQTLFAEAVAAPPTKKALQQWQNKIIDDLQTLTADLRPQYEALAQQCDPALAGVQGRLSKILPLYANYPGLARGCADKTQNAIEAGDLELAEQHTQTWEKFLPTASTNRDTLKSAIDKRRSEQALVKEIEKTIANAVIENDPTPVEGLYNDVISKANTDTRTRLVSQFENKVSQLFANLATQSLEDNRSDESMSLVKRGLSLYPRSQVLLDIQARVGKMTQLETQKRLSDLLIQIENTPISDSVGLSALLAEVEQLDGKIRLVAELGLQTRYQSYIEDVLRDNGPDKAAELLSQWRNTVTEIDGRYRQLEQKILAEQNTDTVAQEIKLALLQNDLAETYAKVNAIVEMAPSETRSTIIDKFSSDYESFLQRLYDDNLSQKEYQQTAEFLTLSDKLLPDSDVVSDRLQNYNQFLSDSVQRGLESAPDQISQTLAQLSALSILNRQNKFIVDPTTFTTLQNALLQYSQTNSLESVRERLEAWQLFNTEGGTRESRKTYDSLINRISLLYYVQGQKLAKSNDLANAKKYLSYALELKPIPTLQQRIEKALQALQ